MEFHAKNINFYPHRVVLILIFARSNRALIFCTRSSRQFFICISSAHFLRLSVATVLLSSPFFSCGYALTLERVLANNAIEKSYFFVNRLLIKCC